jgi:hypothetical protein
VIDLLLVGGAGVVGVAAAKALILADAIFAKRFAFFSGNSDSQVPIRSVIHCKPTGRRRIRKV